MWGRGHAWQGACMVGGVHGSGWHAWQGACMAGGHVWQGGMRGRRGVHGRGVGVAGGYACMAGEMATAADGTHPTGMHSCSFCVCACTEIYLGHNTILCVKSLK